MGDHPAFKCCSNACINLVLRPSTLLILCTLLLIATNAPAIEASGIWRFKCEDLEAERCAFAVTSNGSRCMLEKMVRQDGASDYKCQTSTVAAERPRQWIESEMCIRQCGLQRLSVGFSTDGLHEYSFTNRLCLSDCRKRCPNINDLYTKLAEGEGMKLDDLCDAVRRRMKRLMVARQQRRQQQERGQDLRRKKERNAQPPPAVELKPRAVESAAPSPVPSASDRGSATNPSGLDRGSATRPAAAVAASDGLNKSPAPTPSSSSDDLDDDWFASPAPSSSMASSPPTLPPAILLPPPLPRQYIPFPFPFPNFGSSPPAPGA